MQASVGPIPGIGVCPAGHISEDDECFLDDGSITGSSFVECPDGSTIPAGNTCLNSGTSDGTDDDVIYAQCSITTTETFEGDQYCTFNT